MRIHSMTATFGKLEHQTLTFTPGLNVIHAPNEWGKSTWCAFLVAMLYGIDTRERSTQTALADKERYSPWSGSPMSGRMDIHWNGRDITIERHTKGRAIMGQFNAYETKTGLPVPELTATNCGEVLLGVEKAVFTRSAFIRLTDLPVTDDDSLRRRLNALVTTGDESGASDALAQKLKDLKNSCRHNKTGLLPQAEAQRDGILAKLNQLDRLQGQCQSIRQRQEVLDQQIKELENHLRALEYRAAEEGARRIEAANAARDTAAQILQEEAARCETLPSEEEAVNMLQRLEELQRQWDALQTEATPQMPEPVQVPGPFLGLTGDQAVQQAKSDYAAFQMLSKPLSPVLMILTVVSLLAGIGLAFVKWYLLLPGAVLAVVCYLAHSRSKAAQSRDRQAVCARYGTLPPEQWISLAQQHQAAEAAFTEKKNAYQASSKLLQTRREELTHQTMCLTQGQPLSACISNWHHVLDRFAALQEAQRTWKQASDHAAALAAMAKPVAPPAFPDTLTLSDEQTRRALDEANAERRQLDLHLGQCRGQMESLGQEQVLCQQLEAVSSRIAKLEDTYQALVIAQQTLTDAANALQRRFAPKLAKSAQTLFEKLTHGRYDRLTLGQDLSVRAGAQGEDTLRSGLWRSDGTADQLYLALRLAVSRELMPDAPLVLDDALVRFDDDRLALAMDILQEEAKGKQVILFTCQTRETAFSAESKII